MRKARARGKSRQQVAAEEGAKIYNGKMSAWPEVKKLHDAFPASALNVGIVITDAEISEIIGVPIEERRFSYVVSRWRTELEYEFGKVLKRQWGKHCHTVLDDSGKADLSIKNTRDGLRKVVRAVHIGALVDRSKLTTFECERFDHVQKMNASFIGLEAVRSTVSLPVLQKKSN